MFLSSSLIYVRIQEIEFQPSEPEIIIMFFRNLQQIVFSVFFTQKNKEIVLIIKQLPGKRTNKKKTESLASSDATSCCCFFRLKWEVDVSPLELESVIFPNN